MCIGISGIDFLDVDRVIGKTVTNDKKSCFFTLKM